MLRPIFRVVVLRFGLPGLLWAVASGGWASSIGIDPVVLTLSARQSAETVLVSNHGEERVAVQVAAVAWSQPNGEDFYTPTQALAAEPASFELSPGASQAVRVLRLGPADAQVERCYRLFFEERPVAGQGVRMGLRLVAPVFVKPEVADRPVLRWRAVRIGGDGLRISLTNAGNGHGLLGGFKIFRAGGREPFWSQQQFANLLAGESHYWTLRPAQIPAVGEALHVSAATGQGQVEAEVVLEGG